MINPPLSSFVIHIKVLQVIVKVDTARTEVSSEQRSMSGEDSRDVNVSFSTERDSKTGLPFVEVGNDSCGSLARGELGRCQLCVFRDPIRS